MKQEIYNKEYAIGEIIVGSWHSFKENFQLILWVTLIVHLPINTLVAFFPIDKFMKAKGFLPGFKLYLGVSQLIEGLIGIIAVMAIAYIVKAGVDGQVIGLGQALKKSLSKWLAVIGTNIMLSIFLFGLTLLLIVPGIIYGVYWVFSLYAVVFQNKFGKDAMNYSKAIVKDRWWRVIGYSLVIGLITVTMMLSLGFILRAFSSFILPDNFSFNIISSIISDTVIDFVSTFFTVGSVIFFINFDSTKKQLPQS